jgi:hypothetical protein
MVCSSKRATRHAAWDVGLLAICFCLGMGALFSSVTVIALVVRDRVNPGLALVPPALQKLFTTMAAYPGARHRNKRGFITASLIGSAGYAVAAVAVAAIDDPATSFCLLCVGYCIAGLNDPFVQFTRFTAAEISPKAFKARAISYVVAGGGRWRRRPVRCG